MKPQQSLIRRRKTYRDEEGVIVGYGAEEVYFVAKPRDYETTGKRHIYLRLDRYVQSVIQRQLRKEESTD